MYRSLGAAVPAATELRGTAAAYAAMTQALGFNPPKSVSLTPENKVRLDYGAGYFADFGNISGAIDYYKRVNPLVADYELEILNAFARDNAGALAVQGGEWWRDWLDWGRDRIDDLIRPPIDGIKRPPIKIYEPPVGGGGGISDALLLGGLALGALLLLRKR